MSTPANVLARPSLARVAAIEGFGPCIRGTSWGPGVLCWPIKDPADVLDYVLDASAALFGAEGDSIVTLDVQIAPQESGGLVLDSSAVDGERAVLWLAGGVAGSIYTVTVGLGTASGRYLLRSVSLAVQSLSVAAVPATATQYLIDGSGAPLIDQTGSPLLSS